MLILVLAAALPLLLLAASIAWQNYRLVSRQPLEQVSLLLTAAYARDQTVFEQTARLLQSLAVAPASGAPNHDCVGMLEWALRSFGERYRRLEILNTDRTVRCAAGMPAAQSGAAALLMQAIQRTAGFQVGPITSAPETGHPAVLAGAPLPAASAPGAIIAEMQVDWVALPQSWRESVPGIVTWLVDVRQNLVVATPAMDASQIAQAQPTKATLAALLRPESQPQTAGSQSGKLFAYGMRRLRDSTMLLLAVPATATVGHAEAVLGRWLAEMGLLLLAALLAVAWGGSRLLVQPVRRLSQAVRSWRDGGPFDPGKLEGAPAEITELAEIFAQSAAALRGRETELRAAAARQDLLIQEIHHRVKNNLQIVASLLNLQASRIRLPEARAQFQAARDRIGALATLHRHLYAHDEVQAINMRSFLNELCNQLLQAMGVSPADGRIKLNIEASELEISSDQAVPVALIVTEAVGNAAKYAFPGGRSGHIWVRLETTTAPDGTRHALLAIEDDGVGIPDGPGESETGMRDGIGRQLIRGFARQLGATLTMTQDGGTRYLVDIPLRFEPARPGAVGKVDE